MDLNYQKDTNKKSPLKFFLLVYGLSLPFWLIEPFINIKGLPLDIPITDIIAAFTPLFAACILTYKENDKDAVKNLLLKIFDYKVIKNKKWYFAVLGLPLLIFILIYLTLIILKKDVSTIWHPSLIAIPILFVFFFLGAVGEELGYTGYAVDPLLNKWNALTTSIIIGLPWAIWHYPSIIQQGHNFNWILWGTLGTVAMRILIVWIYNNTNKSLFASILIHTFYNLGRPLFPKDNSHNPLVDYPGIHYTIIALVASVIVLSYGYKTLIRNEIK